MKLLGLLALFVAVAQATTIVSDGDFHAWTVANGKKYTTEEEWAERLDNFRQNARRGTLPVVEGGKWGASMH